MASEQTEAPDCGDNSCLYAMPHQKTGMRTNGGCRCEKADGMQVHSEEAPRGWYYTRKAMRLGRQGMAARDQRIATLEAKLAEARREALEEAASRFDGPGEEAIAAAIHALMRREASWCGEEHGEEKTCSDSSSD